MKLAWATDLHINLAAPGKSEGFYEQIKKSAVDALLITGDIGDKGSDKYIKNIYKEFQKPIYFVLGNHDYYGGQVSKVRMTFRNIYHDTPDINCLSATDSVIKLTDKVGLIGVDGWGDALHGDPNTRVVLCDFFQIADLVGPYMLSKASNNRIHLHEKLRDLADLDAQYLLSLIMEAFDGDQLDTLIVLMHVPPFREASLYNGKQSDNNWAPYFTCKTVGDMLLTEMELRPDKSMVVLCGHCHDKGVVKMLPNLTVKTASASIGFPKVYDIIDVENLYV